MITTLYAKYYQGENSIFETIDQLVARIQNGYMDAINGGYRFKGLNPVNSEDDFTDSWTEEHYEAFYNFIADFGRKWQSLKRTFEYSKNDYIQLFREGIYENSLNERLLSFSESTKDTLAKSSCLITGGVAFTNSKGHINRHEGTRNEAHHNFGGKY